MVDAVRVRFSWPQLQSQDKSGNINGVRIDYAIDVATDSGPYQQVLASSVNRKNITKYERSHRINLPEGSRWSVRARRITSEANSSLVQDGMWIDAIAEVVDSDQEYPLTAVGCLEYDAEQFGGDIAKVAALMRGRIVSVPANYEPETRTYHTSGPGTTNGVWNGTFKQAYTNNPAWVFMIWSCTPTTAWASASMPRRLTAGLSTASHSTATSLCRTAPAAKSRGSPATSTCRNRPRPMRCSGPGLDFPRHGLLGR